MKDEEKFEEAADDRALRRDRKKKKPMPVDGAFLKQVARLQSARAEKMKDRKEKS